MPEQLYASLQTASQADQQPRDEQQQERARRQWLRQFTITLGTDEGDEATTFNGTITQTLMMFNGELTKQATASEEGSYLARIASDTRRRPAGEDPRVVSSRPVSTAHAAGAADGAAIAGGHPQGEQGPLQDLWWALLNSNEFILIH